jgi:putative aldouronate transport system substrate-binding protein
MYMRKQWGKYALATMIVTGLIASGCSNGNGGDNGNGGNGGNPGSTNGANSSEGAVKTDGFPIVETPITLKMFTRVAPVNGPFKDMPVFQDYEKLSNIKVEFIETPTDGFAEKKNLLFASNELPDAIFRSGLSQLESIRYGTAGQLIPLEGLIEEYAPNLKSLMEQYPEIRAGITTPEGHIYAIPGIVTLGSARTDKRWINQSWLDKLGLDVPTTTDDLYNVLTAFRDSDMNGNGQADEIPLTARVGMPIVNQMAGAFGLDSQLGYNINLEDDKVDIWSGNDRHKELLMYLNKLYKEKLIDQEIFSHTEAQFLAKQGTGNTGYFFDQTNNNFLSIQDQYVGIAPPEGPHGDRLHSQILPVPRDYGAFAITSVNKHPEATMRWIDYFYSDEGSTLLRFGREGEHYEMKDGIPYYKEELLAVAEAQAKITPYAGGGAPHIISDKVASFINPPQVQEAFEALEPYLPEIRYAPPMFDEATAQQVNILRNDIDKYIEEQSTKFIVGALSFDKWGEFQSTLEKMNVAELEKLYQEAYDKMDK